MFMFAKNRMIRNQLNDYFLQVRESLDVFQRAMEHELRTGPDEELRREFREVHSHESRADDIRVAIEVTLYEKSLLPEARHDIMHLIESVDRIANRAESVLNQIETQNIAFPPFLHDGIRELIRLSVHAFGLVVDAAATVLSRNEPIRDQVAEIDRLESEGDKVEQDLIRRLFRSDVDKVDRILVRDVILQMGDLTDFCEETAFFLKIFHVKRQV